MVNILSRMLRVCCVLALFAVAATNAIAQEHSLAEQRMVGDWYGEFVASPTGPVQRFITTRRADGTYTLHARMYQGGKMVAEARNTGLWGVSNGMYFTVTTEVNGTRSDPKQPEAINAYLVQSLLADRFEYVHVASGGKFAVTRVDLARVHLPD